MENIFRKVYSPLTQIQKDYIDTFKDSAWELYQHIENCPVNKDARMIELAKNNLEQAVMWAVKAIT